ncbi:MAG: 23S rRNA (guanosine(2251)-2'-O)-methyltransferase RlmB, partial [Magnetovibrio sp.]|nr:23S rRNA (guanosine(2251)-2'-O)-methyltransferase RlmB [Magnetovibrio sp.]
LYAPFGPTLQNLCFPGEKRSKTKRLSGCKKRPMAKRKKHHRSGRGKQDSAHSEGGRESAKRLQKTGGNWLYGVHACMAAIANPERDISRIVVASQSAEDLEVPIVEAANSVYETCLIERPQIEWRDRREIDELVPRDAVHQGIAIETRPLPHPVIEDLIEAAGDMPSAAIVILDQASDPRNIGAVMRTAAALGALGVVVQDKHAPDITGSMAKAASGAVERLPYVKVTNISRAMDLLKASEFWCVGFDGHTDEVLSQKTLRGRNAIVLGAEGAGMRRLTRENCDTLVKIPIGDAVESLNLANAASIALYQFHQSNS